MKPNLSTSSSGERERKRKKKDRRKDYWMESVWHLRMFFDMLFKFVKGE